MSDNQTLEASPSVAQDPSSPAEDVKHDAEEAEQESVSDKQDGEAKGEEGGDKQPQKLTEAERIRQAMQKRIDRQTAASKALQERLAQLEQENTQYKATAPKTDDAPKQDDFDSYEEWEKATIEYRAEKKVQERLQEERQREIKQLEERQALETKAKFEEKEKSVRALYKDYDAVSKDAVEAMNMLAITGKNIAGLRDAVLAFDNPPELIYQLGKDTSLIEELVSMPPLKAMRELVKLEIALTAQTSAKDTEKPAPSPIKGVNGKGGPRPISERSAKDVLEWVKSK